MSLHNTCVAIVLMLLLLQTSCNAGCSHYETAVPSSELSCHGMPVDNRDSAPKPVRHDGSCEDCLLLQAAESKLEGTNLLNAVPVVNGSSTVIRSQACLDASRPGAVFKSLASPVSCTVLRI